MVGKGLPHSPGLELPKLPTDTSLQSNSSFFDAGIIHPDQFSRNNLKSILHIITQELKKRGMKTPYVFLPFRSRINDSHLEKLLSIIFPDGEIIDCTNEKKIEGDLHKFDEFTLICALKYLWARLPNNEIIGWDVYLEFKRKETEKGFPKNAFLSIMPKCLSSPAHASIVYDFLDLMISITSNSHENHLSGRKISKMASFWAFNPIHDKQPQEFSFVEGVEMWSKSTNALFHLVLSFLRSMLPESDMEALKLPKSLQSLLVTNQYPPVEEKGRSLRNMITVPCVYIKSTRPSKNAYDLISKVRYSLSFEKKDSFVSVENYTILKKLFNKKATSEVIDTLTEESKRIISRITADPIDSQYKLQPGWAKSPIPFDEDIPQYSKIEISNVSIQDYYIWTWLSSLGSDQTSHSKRLFGRSIVVEADILGFQKWIVISEKTMGTQEYLHNFNLDQVSTKEKNLPPLPDKSRPSSEETDKDFNDEFSYIYNSSLCTDDNDSTEDIQQSSKELGNNLSRLIIGESFQPKKPRKAPPPSFEYAQTPPISDESETSSEKSPDKTFVEYEIDKRNKLKHEEPLEHFVNTSTTSLDPKVAEQEIEKAKKLEKRAQKAQLAAAQAVGFPFAFLPSNEPPPPPEKAAETARAVSDLMMNTPFLVTIPGSETVLKKGLEHESERESDRETSVSPTRPDNKVKVRKSPAHMDIALDDNKPVQPIPQRRYKEKELPPILLPGTPTLDPSSLASHAAITDLSGLVKSSTEHSHEHPHQHSHQHSSPQRSQDTKDSYQHLPRHLPEHSPDRSTKYLSVAASTQRSTQYHSPEYSPEHSPERLPQHFPEQSPQHSPEHTIMQSSPENRQQVTQDSPVRGFAKSPMTQSTQAGFSGLPPNLGSLPRQAHPTRALAKSPMLQSSQPTFSAPPLSLRSFPQRERIDGYPNVQHPATGTPMPPPQPMVPPRPMTPKSYGSPKLGPQSPGYFPPYPPQPHGSPRQYPQYPQQYAPPHIYGPPPQHYPQYPLPQQYPQYPPQQYPPQQYPLQQYPPQQYPPQQYPPQQYPPQQYPPQQYPPQGYGMRGPRGKYNDMVGVPVVGKHNKNTTENKASLRATFAQGDFGI